MNGYTVYRHLIGSKKWWEHWLTTFTMEYAIATAKIIADTPADIPAFEVVVVERRWECEGSCLPQRNLNGMKVIWRSNP